MKLKAPTRSKRVSKPDADTAPQLRASVTFKGTNALVQLMPPATVQAIVLDGDALAPERWRITDQGVLRIACPPAAFDTALHTLRIETDAGAVALPFRSDYRHAIETLTPTRIGGWIYDVLRPTSSLELVVVSAEAVQSVLNTLPSAHVAAVAPEVIGGGFDIQLPPRSVRSAAEVVRITVRGTDIMPFGPLLCGTTLAAHVAALTQPGHGRDALALLLGTGLLPQTIRALVATPADTGLLDGARRLPPGNGLPRPQAPSVLVIVPVYRGQAETLACLASLRPSGDHLSRRVLVIDDCSPEPDLSEALRALAVAGEIEYLRNDTNLGFVGTVNRGMALRGEADVLLLNADTVMPAGGIDRLYRAAYADAAIATATPLSNNATICSLPAPPGTDGAPFALPPAAIDAIAAEVNAGEVRDIPTAHGFCMFIKHAALTDVGLFDADSFGVGYGEENDFSLRALERGWRNVCAADVYVAHTGSVSYSDRRAPLIAANLAIVEARYPYYHDFVADFLRSDPLHTLRNRVQKAVWQRHERIVVFITLSLEGGAVRHVDDMMARLTDEGFLALALAIRMDHDRRPMPALWRWNSEELLRYPQPAPIGEVLGDILDLAPKFLHVQHLLDLPAAVGSFVRDCGIPYAVTLHDFFYGCPRVTLLDAGGAYCGMPAAAHCAACVREGGSHVSLHPSHAEDARDGERWRAKWGRLLGDAVHVFAPSQDTAQRFAALFPGVRVEVRPHPRGSYAPPAPVRRPATAGPGLRVAVPGAIGLQKGSRQLRDLARHCSRWDDDIRLVVVGRTDDDPLLEEFATISLAGSYRQGEAVAALQAAQCRVALFLSIFPETYSYTLSESLEAGLVPVAYDFGAIGDRLRTLGVGVLVPLGAPAAEVVAAIRRAAEMPPPVVPPAALWGQYARLYGDYYGPALTDLADVAPPPDLPRVLAWPSGVEPDRWCGGEIRLQVWAAQPVRLVAVSFWVPPPGRLQGVAILWHGPSGLISVAHAFLIENDVRRVICPIPPHGDRVVSLTCRFDYLFRLAPPDIRSGAAMLHGVEVGDGAGWQTADLPDCDA